MSNLQEVKNTAENSLINKIKEIKNSGVEFRKLGEVCKRQKGINITALQMKELNKDNGKIRIFAGGNTIANVNYEDIPNASIINIPSIIVKSRGKVDFEYYDKPFTHKNELWSYSQNSDKINLKFIYYYLCNNLDYFIKKSVRGAMPQIATPDTDDFEIPIPPLEVQAEIVRILDTFTELIKELIKEHELRKKQYSYYRDKLLTFGEDTLRVKLGSIAEIKGRIGFRGYTRKDQRPKGEGAISLSPGNIVNNNMIYLDNTYISWEKYEESPEIMINEGDVIFCKTGSTLGKVAIIENLLQKTTINPQLVVFKNIKCNNRFLKYVIAGKRFQDNVNKLKGVGTVPNITQEKLGSIEFPLPPIDTQKRIVDLLDNFERYTNDLQKGLPAEIEKRKKQYAYYRDELLKFERK